MTIAGTTLDERLAVGFVEFKPSDKWYMIRVGSKGVLANRDTEFFSKHDVMHPPMKSASIRRQFDEAVAAMRLHPRSPAQEDEVPAAMALELE